MENQDKNFEENPVVESNLILNTLNLCYSLNINIVRKWSESFSSLFHVKALSYVCVKFRTLQLTQHEIILRLITRLHCSTGSNCRRANDLSEMGRLEGEGKPYKARR